MKAKIEQTCDKPQTLSWDKVRTKVGLYDVIRADIGEATHIMVVKDSVSSACQYIYFMPDGTINCLVGALGIFPNRRYMLSTDKVVIGN